LPFFVFGPGSARSLVQIEYVAPLHKADEFVKTVLRRLQCYGPLADVANYDTRTVLENGLEVNLSIAYETDAQNGGQRRNALETSKL
jgi:hypothetical protein